MADPITTRSAEETKLLERARQRLPGGVLGTCRYADDVGFVVKHGKGSKIYDVSGREHLQGARGTHDRCLVATRVSRGAVRPPCAHHPRSGASTAAFTTAL